MYLNHFNTTDMARLDQILATLKNVHGIVMRFDLADPGTKGQLTECIRYWDEQRGRIVAESRFNTYQQNPDYIKSMLILEAARIMLKEIAPKRRRNKMNESDMSAEPHHQHQHQHQQPHKKSRLSMQLSDIAAKIPEWSEEAAAFSNELAAMSDRLRHGEGLTSMQKEILSWMRELPKPIKLSAIADEGTAKYGTKLAAARKADLAALPKVDMTKEGKDQDGDGDSDFADIMVARMVKSGMPKGKAIAQTAKKTYNKESQDTAGPLSAFKKKEVPGVYHYDHFEDPHGNWIQVRGDKSEFAYFDKATGNISSFANANDLKAHIFKHNHADVQRMDELSPDTVQNYANAAQKDFNRINTWAKDEGGGTYNQRKKETPRHWSTKKQDKRVAGLQMAKNRGIVPTKKHAGKSVSSADQLRSDSRGSMGGGGFRPVDEAVNKAVETDALAMTSAPEMTQTSVIPQATTMPAGQSSATTPAAGRAHHYEYQASMARSELYRNAKYAMSMMQQVDPKGEVHPWIAGSLTKAANLLDKVYHYLDYYKTFEPDKLPESEDDDLGETSGGVTRQNLMLIVEYSTKLFEMIKPGDKLEGWVAMKLTTASEAVSCCKHYMDYVQFEKHAQPQDFLDKTHGLSESAPAAPLMEAEDLAKAATIIDAKNMASKVQEIAEDLAEMSVEDLMPLVDIMRSQFGPEAAEGFNQSVKDVLTKLLDQAVQAKHTMDDAIDTLSGGGVPSAQTDLEKPEAMDDMQADVSDDTDIAKDLEALAGSEPEAEEPTAPLGREKKEVSEDLNEAWGTKMHTAKQDVGKWEGWTIAKLQSRLKKLQDKEQRTAAEQKEVKQIQFAIRAKHKGAKQWGKVKESGNDQMTEAAKATKGKVPDAFKKNIEKMKAKKHKDDNKPVKESADVAVHEKAPPGKKAEEFIRNNKASFKKRYGERGEEVLYATAWKKFGPKSESFNRLSSELETVRSNIVKLEAQMEAHRRQFRQQVQEGKVSDPLGMGYGLEGDAILDRLSRTHKEMAAIKHKLGAIISEGITALRTEISAANKAQALEKIKSKSPYGVVYQEGNQRATRMFETADARDTWVSYMAESIKTVSLIDPDTLDRAISSMRNKS